MYFITMLNINNNEVTESKTIGYVSDKEEAENRVKSNDNAIFIKGENSYYDYAIISDVSTGFSLNIYNIQWFKYNRTEEDVEVTTQTFGDEVIRKVDISIEEISAPEGFENYIPSILA